jgi:nucleoid-associated protein YgaU
MPLGAPARAIDAAPDRRRTTILIHPGDTFHDLATKYLGSKYRTGELIKANPQIRDPNVLYVGQIVHLPSNRKNDHARVVQ